MFAPRFSRPFWKSVSSSRILQAVAGQSYYFRTQLLTSRSIELLELQKIDSDEAGYLYSEYPMATATAKKD